VHFADECDAGCGWDSILDSDVHGVPLSDQ
jgi:hypothetical protein